jgi:cardiolipin synthase
MSHPGRQSGLRHLPNLICLFRILLVWPIVQSVLAGHLALALALILLAGASDGLDGFLAKHFGWRSRLGGLLDPLADKLLLVATFMTLAWVGLLPLWLAAVVLGRDLVIVTGGMAYQFLIGPVQPSPTLVSKFNTGAQLLCVLSALAGQVFGWPERPVLVAFGALVLTTSVVSGLDYVIRWSAKAAGAGARA